MFGPYFVKQYLGSFLVLHITMITLMGESWLLYSNCDGLRLMTSVDAELLKIVTAATNKD